MHKSWNYGQGGGPLALCCFQCVRGMADYRSGETAGAVDWLSLSGEQDAHACCRAESDLLLAMAYQELGQAEAAGLVVSVQPNSAMLSVTARAMLYFLIVQSKPAPPWHLQV